MSGEHHEFDEPLISGYVDGELTQADDQRVRLHLDECAQCRQTADELRLLKEATMAGPLAGRPAPPHWARMRHLVLTLALVGVIVAACGGDEVSLPEYVDRLNGAVAEGRARIEPLYAELGPGEPTIEAVRSLFEQEASIRSDLQESLGDIAAPEQIADLHDALINWHGRLIEAEKSLAASAVSASSWSDLQESSEYRQFDSLMQEGLAGCLELQETLDATAARGAFSGMPWIPGELKEIVNAALGCEAPPSG